MKMTIDSNDIYDVQIEDVNTGRNSVGCPEGYSDFEVDVDDVDQDGDITIEISGTCTSFGYHNPMPCTFEGTLTMDEDDFTYEYTRAAEDGAKYIIFEGNIEISETSGEGIELDDSYIDGIPGRKNLTETIEKLAKNYVSLFCMKISYLTDEMLQMFNRRNCR